jgi:ABC-2 type transport system permease protein
MESSTSPTQEKPIAMRKNPFSRIMDNPIITKELKGRMRGRQGFIILGSYLALISLFIGLIYLFLAVEGNISNGNPGYLQTVGKVIFSTVVLLELLMLGFIGPALTAGAISSEREHKTIDLLRTSLLSARALVFGKLSSAVVFLLLLIFTAIPIESLAFFLGGVGMAEMVISTLMLVITAIFFCTLGLFFSSFSKRTLISTVFSYASILLSLIVFILFLFFIGVGSSYNSYPSALIENIVTALIWFLLSTNPFYSATISEVILIDEQSLFITTSNFFGTSTFPLPSPWIIYVIFYSILTVLLIGLSVYFVKRPDR